MIENSFLAFTLSFGKFWRAWQKSLRETGDPPEPSAISNAIGYAKFHSRSHDAVIRVYDAAGNIIDERTPPGSGQLEMTAPRVAKLLRRFWLDSFEGLGYRRI